MSFFQTLTSPPILLRLAIGLCYIGLGVYTLTNSNVFYFLDQRYRTVLAVVFIAYGAFRLYRVQNDASNA